MDSRAPELSNPPNGQLPKGPFLWAPLALALIVFVLTASMLFLAGMARQAKSGLAGDGMALLRAFGSR